jgi:hypothetical protein
MVLFYGCQHSDIHQDAYSYNKDLLQYTGHTQKNGAASKVIKEFISHPTRTQHTLSAAGTVHVSHALPAVCFPCLLWGCGTSFQDL